MQVITLPLPRKQKGASPFLILLLISVIFFVAMLAFKVGPHYLDYRAIKQTVEGFEKARHGAAGTTVAIKTPAAFYRYMQKGMEMNSIREFKPEEIMKVERSANQFIVNIDYERREPMFKNLFVVVHFKEEFRVRIP